LTGDPRFAAFTAIEPSLNACSLDFSGISGTRSPVSPLKGG
jgi:hypothetical protein